MRERTERQRLLLSALTASPEPLTGSELAQQCGVTRQVVVHDIALLRAAGENILSTPRGYRLQSAEPKLCRYVVSVNHPPEMTVLELNTFVDCGVQVMDVVVEHPVYGELKGSLDLASRRDVEVFMRHIQEDVAPLLSSLTAGTHIHHLSCLRREAVEEAITRLQAIGVCVYWWDSLDDPPSLS
jgi:transcriptional regulator of NAD metabolism